MSTRRICLRDGPFHDSYSDVGGVAPPQALWAVRDEEGDIGCTKGLKDQPPKLDHGECLVGVYTFDSGAGQYVWRPSPRFRSHPGRCEPESWDTTEPRAG